jgi:hypothetical protein
MIKRSLPSFRHPTIVIVVAIKLLLWKSTNRCRRRFCNLIQHRDEENLIWGERHPSTFCNFENGNQVEGTVRYVTLRYVTCFKKNTTQNNNRKRFPKLKVSVATTNYLCLVYYNDRILHWVHSIARCYSRTQQLSSDNNKESSRYIWKISCPRNRWDEIVRG